MFGKKLSLSLIVLCFSFPVFAFTYNQKMIEYRGGVISELNNCGPTYSDNGKYLQGQRNLSAKLTTTSNDVESFDFIAGGIITALKNGDVFFSPDGRYLDGGGSTLKLVNVTKSYVDSTTKWGTPIYADYINTIGVLGSTLLVIQTKQGKEYSTGKIIGKTCVRGSSICTDVYEKGYLSDITAIDLPSGLVRKFTYKSGLRRIQKALGNVNGVLYVQFSNGDIGKFNSVSELSGVDTINVLHLAAPSLKKIIPYRHGLLAYNKNVAYWSNNYNQVISGSDVKQIYSGAKSISALLNYQGNSATESNARPNASQGLIIAFEDGNVYFSPDGNNFTGGGTTVQLSKPFDTVFLKERMVAYLNGLSKPSSPFSQDPLWLQNPQPDQYKNPTTGAEINVKNLSVRLLNKGDTTEYAKNTVIADGNVYSKVSSLVSDFGGEPTTVTVYDKGWDGIEYKWRDRGQRTGLVDHKVEASYVGVPEIRLKATSGCAIAVSYEEIGGNIKPFTLIDWSVNADFSVANNNAGISGVTTAFAPGGVDFSDILPINYMLMPNKFTLMEIYNWSIYNAKVYIKDKYGINVIRGPLPLYYMRTDADRQRFPN
ncbi:hypothetical protein [Cellvibrio sp.]